VSIVTVLEASTGDASGTAFAGSDGPRGVGLGLQSDVALLNDRRRLLVRQFVDELRLAQSEEIRRREDHAA
jgi:hypothetical protein